MEVENTHPSEPQMTPDEQGVFFDLLKKQIPGWILESPQELRTALYESMKSSILSRSAVLEELRAFKNPEHFCAPLLAEAIGAKLARPLQIQGVIFQHVRSTSSLLGLRKKLVLPIERDLLKAACENFELSETRAENYNEQSLIYIPAPDAGNTHEVLPIQPHEFAQLCRVLDLGKSYQAHVSGFFGDNTQLGSLRKKATAYLKARFEVERHLAYMQKHIEKDVYEMLKSVVEGSPSVILGQNALGYQCLKMLGKKLNGPMFIGPVSEHADDDYRCVVYVPGDPLHPLKQYASFAQFEVELNERLRSPEFRQFFMRFIKLADRAEFLARLNKSHSVKATLWTNMSHVQVDGIDLEAKSDNDLFLEMYRQHAAQVLADARVLVVPTDDEDEKSRLARLETYKAIGLNVFLFMGSFVPVLGDMMFAVAGAQFLGTVYEGISAWAAGEQELALDYLCDTVENMIVMAALTAVGQAASGVFRVVSKSDFVSRLRQVPTLTGGMRLWKADLADYRVPQIIPDRLQANELGVLTYNRDRYVRIGSDHFAVTPKNDSEAWEVQPPTPRRYSPVLETNGAGAWRHDSELIQAWSPLTLFRRLGYHPDQVADSRASQILAATGINEHQLRRVFVERRKPMATLVDTVRRFGADAAVNRFIWQMGQSSSMAVADADLQIFLLTSAANWPKDIAVSVADTLGHELNRYGPAIAQQLKLEQALLRKGTFYPALLAGLKKPQRTLLLGTASEDQLSQIGALRELLVDIAERSRPALFERLYRRTDVADEAMAAPVTRAFPRLPGSVADELALNADASEWRQLEAGKLPLRLSEEARRYRQVVSLNRAYEGLYLDVGSDLNTDLIVLGALSRLPGWPQDVYVEITGEGMPSADKATTGPVGARHSVFFKASEGGYRATDANGTLLAESPSRTRAHYFRVLRQSLPGHAQKTLGVEADEGGADLRQKITESALQRRDEMARLVARQSLRAGYRSPMGLADPRGTAVVRFRQTARVCELTGSAALQQRARELYPLHSLEQIESFLVTLGNDEVLATRALEALRGQYDTMRNTLEHWVQRETHYHDADGARHVVPRRSKAMAAQAILRAWRKEPDTVEQPSAMLDSLTFDTQPLGPLPTVIGDFRHIGALEMNGVGESAGLGAFLKNFPNLHSLSLTGNGLTRLSSAVNEMPHLTHLDLSDNRIALTAEAAASLAAKHRLQSLNLSFNPTLGRLPAFGSMRNLQHLALRGIGVSEWPTGLVGHPTLKTLDLRDNRIEALADAVFKARKELNEGTNVDGNPLSAKALEKIVRYQQSTGVNFGVVAADYTHAPAGLLPDSALGAYWANVLPRGEVPQMQAAWASLSAYPQSRDFFLVLDQMRGTADDSRQHSQLAARVWDLIQATAEDDSLRGELFRMARVGRVGADEPGSLFSDLETGVLCHRAMRAARTGERSLEGELVRLLRGLFRLQALQKRAQIDIANRQSAHGISRWQAHELSLIYRSRLAQRLDLPTQPSAIDTGFGVDVSEQQLNEAYAQVVNAENSSALLDSIDAQPFWTQYLHSTYQGLFLRVQERTAQAFAELETQTDLSRSTASQRMMAIMDNHRNENRNLLRRLTQEALARHPGLAKPLSPTAKRWETLRP